MALQESYMTKNDVRAGRRFYYKEDFRTHCFSFSKLFGKRLIVKNAGQTKIGEVTGIFEDGFLLSVWFFNQEISIIIPYSELILIEPKNS